MNVKPHPEYDRILRAINRIVRRGEARPWSGELFRSATPKYAGSTDLVTGAGSRMNGGRWNAAGTFPAVYASTTPELAMAEVLAHYHRFGIPESKAMPRMFKAITVKLSRVVDLTDGAVRQSLRVSLDRMVGDEWWAFQSGGKESLAQAIGRAAY